MVSTSPSFAGERWSTHGAWVDRPGIGSGNVYSSRGGNVSNMPDADCGCVWNGWLLCDAMAVLENHKIDNTDLFARKDINTDIVTIDERRLCRDLVS